LPRLFSPAEHQEGLQVLHYTNGQKYEPHVSQPTTFC
jgi:hypothetical protein